MKSPEPLTHKTAPQQCTESIPPERQAAYEARLDPQHRPAESDALDQLVLGGQPGAETWRRTEGLFGVML